MNVKKYRGSKRIMKKQLLAIKINWFLWLKPETGFSLPSFRNIAHP